MKKPLAVKKPKPLMDCYVAGFTKGKNVKKVRVVVE